MCGEKKLVREFCLEHRGSPPRVRGKESKMSWHRKRQRITPACAGKSFFCIFKKSCSKDHPRVCGEKVQFTCRSATSRGSPPRVRGKVCTHLWTVERDRITPACAGKSCPLSLHEFARRDHPRVCGEKYFAKGKPPDMPGSPPRVRGKAVCNSILEDNDRITPACAGKRGCQIPR